MIEHSEQKIYLIWQEAAQENRHVIGELTEKTSEHYVFRSLQSKITNKEYSDLTKFKAEPHI